MAGLAGSTNDGVDPGSRAVSSGAASSRAALGIDVGGTGIKAAVVEVETGALLSRRIRVGTPQPATPSDIAKAVKQLVEMIAADYELPADLPVGCTMPAVIKGGVAQTAANIDKGWIGTSVEDVFGQALGRRVYALNDADAAAIAEARLGAGRDVVGTVLLLTIGTGIGSGLLVDGHLVPNTEFGHVEMRGKDAEIRLSGVARERRQLRWKQWAIEFNDYLARLELYVSPDLIILGGGVSKAIDRYREWLKSRAPIVPAHFLNAAGIIGAALAAVEVDTALDANLPAPSLSAVSEG
ncbi:MAG: polyphosphate--glucose phosphotransferase [Candidatus Limnocylindrales bacterium]